MTPEGGILFLPQMANTQTGNGIQPLCNLPVRSPLPLSFLSCHTKTPTTTGAVQTDRSAYARGHRMLTQTHMDPDGAAAE